MIMLTCAGDQADLGIHRGQQTGHNQYYDEHEMTRQTCNGMGNMYGALMAFRRPTEDALSP